jgi:hypothetical protein
MLSKKNKKGTWKKTLQKTINEGTEDQNSGT